MKRLFRDRRARRYLLGQTLSVFGDMTLWLAMGIWVKTLTGSSGAAGLTFFFFSLPSLGSPLSGLLVDRLRRRPLLIWTNLGTAALVLLLLLVHSRGQVWLIYTVMFFYGASYTVLGSGGSALLRLLLPDELLAEGNGYLQTVREGFRLLAPIAGAGLFVLFGGGAVAVIDAATFVAAAVLPWSVRVDEPARLPATEHWRRQVTAGLRHLRDTPVLRQICIATAASLLVVGAFESAIFAVIGQGLHRTPSFLGVLVVVQGAGAVAGGPIAAPVFRRIGSGMTIALGMLLIGLATPLLTLASLPPVFVGLALIGFGLPWVVVGLGTAIQLHSPLDLQGRVSSAVDLLVGTPQTISIAIGAALVTVVDYRIVLAVIAVVVVASSLYLLTRREQRLVRWPAPSPVELPVG
jgi:MFS family permease